MNDAITIRKAQPGEPSLAANFYYHLFADEFDFYPNVEQYFLHSSAELFDDPQGSCLWLAFSQNQIVGSIAIIKHADDTAQLRLFGTDPKVQGHGLGRRLIETALAFCQTQAYHHVFLWTINICQAAVHLYQTYGFKLTDSKPNTVWAAYLMTEERMDLDLQH